MIDDSLREKCPNTDFFLVRIFPHLDWMGRDTEYLFVFSPNAVKYGLEKAQYLDTFRTAIDIVLNDLQGRIGDYVNHCVKSVQIRSFFWSVFSCIRT